MRSESIQVYGRFETEARRLYHQPLIINNEENEQLMVMEELAERRRLEFSDLDLRPDVSFEFEKYNFSNL